MHVIFQEKGYTEKEKSKYIKKCCTHGYLGRSVMIWLTMVEGFPIGAWRTRIK
jgi:hypothetical protein